MCKFYKLVEQTLMGLTNYFFPYISRRKYTGSNSFLMLNGPLSTSERNALQMCVCNRMSAPDSRQREEFKGFFFSN